MKNMYIEQLQAGDILEREVFFLRTFEEKISNGDPYYMARFEDKTGYIYGKMNKVNYTEVCEKIVGKPVYLSGVIVWSNSKLSVNIARMELCEDFDIAELSNGLTDEEIEEKKNSILGLIARFNLESPERKLVSALYDDAMLQAMSERPSSLTQGGRYRGGLLCAVDTVVKLAISISRIYWNHRNHIYTKKPQCALVVTAVLVYYAVKSCEYTSYPFKRTEVAILEGFQAIAGSLIAKAETKCGALPESFKKQLIHIIVSVEDSKIKAVSKEAIIVENAIALYNNCDEIDDVISEIHEQGKSGVVYSKRLGRYVYTEQEE